MSEADVGFGALPLSDPALLLLIFKTYGTFFKNPHNLFLCVDSLFFVYTSRVNNTPSTSTPPVLN